jgi:Chaperone of endosialidase
MKTKSSAILIAVVFGFMVFLPTAHAISPTPDGCHPGFTTAEGCNALNFLTTGTGNTGLGWRSLFLDSTGSFNTGVGAGTLVLNTADSNTAVGAAALLLNTTGTENVAIGTTALVYNDSGSENTATGSGALQGNTFGDRNTAVGSQALFTNTEGHGNTAIGASALSANTTDGFNTATGSDALLNNTSGLNTANGAEALFSNTQGNTNTAVGFHALFANTTGVGNVALGGNAGDAQTTGNNNVYIALPGVAGESNHTYIRNINFTSVSGGGTDTVTVNLTTGLLGHLSSSRRYKEEIKPMDKASETLYRLNPVTYRYKKEVDPTQSPTFGLIAEEVAQVNHELVACNAEGQPESVHYEMVNAMLLNEFLKEHNKVEEQGEIIAKQQKQIETLTAGLQNVSAQIEMMRPTKRVAVGNP